MSLDRVVTGGIYTDKRIHCNDQKILHELTSPRVWEWSRFREIIIDLSILGAGNFVPAINRPDTIQLKGLWKTIADLQVLSEEKGKETSKVIFADRERRCLVISGQTAIGTQVSVTLTAKTEPGREQQQQRVVTIHTHPNGAASNGLSDTDYLTFIGDPKQIAMIVTYEGGLIMPLKTTVTPNTMAKNDIVRRLADLRCDFFDRPNKQPMLKVADLNKAVCVEFGLTLYTATKRARDMVQRAEVTR